MTEKTNETPQQVEQKLPEPKKTKQVPKHGNAYTGRGTPIPTTTTPIPTRHRPIRRGRHQPINKTNPIAGILYALEQLLAGKLNEEITTTIVDQFYQDFMLYMRDSKAMAGAPQLALKNYLYRLETSIGKGNDPRQNDQFELLKDYLAQVAQKYPYPHFMLGLYASQLSKYINTYQNQFRNPEAEKQIRGYRQVYVGSTSNKVLRIGYSKEVSQHELYLIDETNDQLIDQHQYPEQNQEMIAGLYVGQALYVHLLFGEMHSWSEGKMKGSATPESQIKNYNDMPFGIELAVSVLTPVGVMNSAYMLSTGKDLFHPEKKKLSNWEKTFAVADLVLVLPLGKILKIPGKVAAKIGRSSDEAAALLNTGKKAGDDFVVTVAEGSKYAQRFIEAEAQLAAKQAQKAAAIKKADEAYQGYKDIQKAKHARKAAKGMDGVLYIKFYPSIDPGLAYQAVRMYFAEVSRGYATFATWLAKLRQHKVAAQFMKNAAEDELYGLYIAIKDIKKNDELYKEIVEALRTQNLKKVEDLIAGNSFKAEFASALLSYAKVAYSKNNDMAIKAIMYRINKLGQKGAGKAHHAASGSNVAIFEYITHLSHPFF